MHFTVAEITGLLGSYMWPFIRITAMIMVAPIFSSNFITSAHKILIALAISIVIIPAIPIAVPAVSPLSGSGILIVIHQIIIGICMGFMLKILFDTFIMAGQINAMQMGLGYASIVDPQNGITIPVISQFYLIFVTLVFLSIDGHLILLGVLSESFVTLPISASGIPYTSFFDLAKMAGWLYASAVIIALPSIGSLLLVNLTFGILSRAAPQISPFSIGFPMSIMLGFIIMSINLSNVSAHLVSLSNEMLQMTRLLVMPNG